MDVLHERRIDLPNPLGGSIWRFEFALAIRQFDLPDRIADSNSISYRQFDLAILFGAIRFGRFAFA
jgi:hypothetical protein